MSKGIPERAIVIGASLGGLLAARVLFEHFREVFVLERDELPETIAQRRGVPQGRHTHGLLASGGRALEALFPNLSKELIEAGAVRGDIANRSRRFFEGGLLARFVSGLDGILMSRPLLEASVRQRVKAISNVQLCDRIRVLSLAASSDRARITGVRTEDGEWPATLIVDATGRGSQSPKLLAELGYPVPLEERIEIGLSYTTRLFRRRSEQLGGDLMAVIPATPSGKRGGVILAQEDDRWTVTLWSYFGNGPDTDLADFRAFARSLPASHIYDAIQDADPIGEAIASRFPASVRRRYERLKAFPSGLIVFGDAISSFNPLHGQGMSVAAQEALALQREIRGGLDGLATRFFRSAAKIIDTPWRITASADLRIPETVGPRTTSVRLMNWYMSRLHRAGHRDAAIALAFHKVVNLIAPAPSLLAPGIIFRVVKGNLLPRSDGVSRSALREA
ncbi:MAG: FAD-dependent monooxygenase [Acidobacteriaceae bacterium]|nr:FAD-dependent monooxygenase [Acidobacteriaceae bacterium]MBV9295294.1 FAD-dependent monooxygenase [Acidobacteriaceae bacterium]MBV9778329.1 FAD-dependent monooxygenase [Acidobacteriaceae bacterium]